MCGLAGLAAADPRRAGPALDETQASEVSLMLSTLAHRGPDGQGIVSRGGASLGHRRLAIIDLSERAAQPMPLLCHGGPAEPAVWVALNGEIYNYLELREELRARGHRFRTDSDTEVILHLYEEDGPACPSRLRGMFAFALWDSRDRRMLLVRDRMGKKPLYYRVGPDGLAFASEIKALAALARSRGEPVEPDPASIRSYLALKYVPGPGTAFKGILKVPPAGVLTYERGAARLDRYWRLPEAAPEEEVTPGRRAELLEELRAALATSVEIRMRSDVPLGLFLSGGLDSAIVARLMAAASPSVRLRTFTVGFDEPDYDELREAAAMARAIGADHHEIVIRSTPGQTVDELPDLAWHLDQPFADSSALAVSRLARAVRRHVTVALSGDGGDELFLGYDRYRAHRLAQRLTGGAARIAKAPVRAARRAVEILAPAAPGRRNLSGRARRFLEGAALDPLDRNDAWVTCIDARMAEEILTPDLLASAASGGCLDPLAALHRAYGEGDGGRGASWLGRVQRADLLVYLPDDILHKVDAATMSHALEARAPLLDHQVVELALRIPSSLSLPASGRRAGKLILREAYAADLPPATLRKRKAGFGLPLDHWLRRDLAGYTRDLLLDPGTLARGLTRREGVEALLRDHVEGRANREDAIWALVMLEHWFRALVDAGRRPVPAGASPEAAAARTGAAPR